MFLRSGLTARTPMPPRLLALLFGLVGAAVAIGALAGLASEWRFGQRAARASGEVLRLDAGGSHPEIAFTAADGQAVSYPQNGLVSGFRVGDRVDVLYDADDPRRAVVDRFGARYGFSGLAALLGTVFLVVAAVQGRRSEPLTRGPGARGR